MNKQADLLKFAEETSVEFLEKQGHHFPQLIMVNKDDGVSIILVNIDMDDWEAKEEFLRSTRAFVKEHEIVRYYYIAEAWMVKRNAKKPDMPFVQPSRCVDREEVLVIQEFNQDMTGRSVLRPFARQGKTIVWGERVVDNLQPDSMWNFYIELDGVLEKNTKLRKDVTERFFRQQSKKLSKKYYQEFCDAKTPEERIAVLKKVTDDAARMKREVDKRIYEVPDD